MTDLMRPAAKAILFVPNGEVVLAAGSRGMLNLPGGGLDGDSPSIAVMRELAEEIGVTACELERPLEHAGLVEGPVVNRYGIGHMACWAVFRGYIREGVTLSPQAEITAVETLHPEVAAALGEPVVSNLAANAIRHFGLAPSRV